MTVHSLCNVLPAHCRKVLWCRVIAPFHHCMFGSRPSISCEFITIKRAISGGGDQLRLLEACSEDGWSRFIPPPLYRALWSIEGESWSGLQIKAITLCLWRRKSGSRLVLASQTAILPQLSSVYGHKFLVPPPPAHHPTLLVAAFSLKFIISCSP